MAEAGLATPPFGLTGARRALAIAAAAVVLTGVFVVQGFPYQYLVPRAEQLVSAATGAPVRIGRVGIGFAWLGPQLRAWDVDASLPDGTRLKLDRLRVHPAWSTSWLRGDPSLVLALRAPQGELDGTVTIGGEPGFRGELRGVRLAELPLAAYLAGASLDGVASADLDVSLTEAGPVGTVKLSAENGSVTVPLLPIGVPFDSLDGDVELGGEGLLAKIGALDVKGPLVSISASGTIGSAPVATAAPLALRAKLEIAEPSLRSMLTGQGISLDANGAAELQIGGTLGEPMAQPVAGRGRAG
jgi:type II secretion system protein N